MSTYLYLNRQKQLQLQSALRRSRVDKQLQQSKLRRSRVQAQIQAQSILRRSRLQNQNTLRRVASHSYFKRNQLPDYLRRDRIQIQLTAQKILRNDVLKRSLSKHKIALHKQLSMNKLKRMNLYANLFTNNLISFNKYIIQSQILGSQFNRPINQNCNYECMRRRL